MSEMRTDTRGSWQLIDRSTAASRRIHLVNGSRRKQWRDVAGTRFEDMAECYAGGGFLMRPADNGPDQGRDRQAKEYKETDFGVSARSSEKFISGLYPVSYVAGNGGHIGEPVAQTGFDV